jgi:hypothetical protein
MLQPLDIMWRAPEKYLAGAKKLSGGRQNIMWRPPDKNISLTWHLLASVGNSKLVLPIYLYCCEVWGNDLMIKDNDSHPFELLHSKIKEMLGVHCKTSNIAYRAELNRLPLQNM